METLYFRICAFLGLLAGAVIVALPLRRQFADFHEFVRRTPKWQRAFLALLAAVLIAYGSTKTNQVCESESEVEVEQWNLPTCSAGQPEQGFNLLCSTSTSDYDYLPPTVTPTDIARGWQLVGVDTNAAVDYAMPEGAVLASNWWVRGAFDDVVKIGLGGLESLGGLNWRFPFGTNTNSSLWAFSWGKVRFLFDDTNEIVAVGAPMSAVPYRSRLWTIETTNAFLVTWENFAVNRDTNTPINAQLELHRSGDFVTRSNAVETAYRRVCPEDWDDDGIPNVRDLRPYFRDGDFFGPGQTLPDGANEDAYCWVEISADVNAHVVFSGDGESDLPDPDFMIRAGETNRVTLLIGKTYSVESTQPLTVTDRSDGAIGVGGNGSCALSVLWPVTVYAMEGNGAGFMMRVVPNRVGGEFVWDDDCCPITGSGRVFSWGCNGLCLCTGCTAQGALLYEGYSIPVTGGHCGCSYGPRQAETEPDDDQMVAGVSASFSPEAVIFEDAYTNMPGEVVGRRSTEAVLSCAVHGGFRGGTATFSFAGETNLVWIRGAAVPQSSVAIPPGEKLEFAAAYEGLRPSAEAEDITYTVTFTENDTTNGPSTVTAKLTSVKVELTAVYDAPENPNPSRHVYGVGEKIKFTVMPTLSEVSITTVKLDEGDGGCAYELFDGCYTSVDGGAEHTYVCPVSANYHPPIRIEMSGAEYAPLLTLTEPQYVLTPEADWFGCHAIGDVGQSTLITTNYIGPMTVSFQGIKVAEVPCNEVITPIGYFATTNFTGYLSHTADEGAGIGAGAGHTRRIQAGNRWTVDEAGGGLYRNWSEGRLEWKIPIGWFRIRPGEYEFGDIEYAEKERSIDPNSRMLLIGGRSDMYKQVMTIGDDGTSKVEKFGHWLSRGRYCRIILDGETKQWTHGIFEEH